MEFDVTNHDACFHWHRVRRKNRKSAHSIVGIWNRVGSSCTSETRTQWSFEEREWRNNLSFHFWELIPKIFYLQVCSKSNRITLLGFQLSISRKTFRTMKIAMLDYHPFCSWRNLHQYKKYDYQLSSQSGHSSLIHQLAESAFFPFEMSLLECFVSSSWRFCIAVIEEKVQCIAYGLCAVS